MGRRLRSSVRCQLPPTGRLQEAESDATRLLRDNWALVLHLTGALLAADTLDGTEFAREVANFKR